MSQQSTVLRPVTNPATAASTSDLRTDRWHIVAHRAMAPDGLVNGWDYTIRDQKTWHDLLHAGKVIATHAVIDGATV
jgi:hypothetical protein